MNFDEFFVKIRADISDFKGKMNSASGEIGKSVKNIEENIKNVGGGIQNIGNGFKDVGGKLTKYITVPALAAASALGGITLVKGFGRVTGIDTARAKLKGLGHDAKGVEAIMESALESVLGTSYGLDEAATTAASAVAAGVEPGKELTRYLTITADAAAIAGISMGEMGSIINKVQTSQRATNQEIKQLAERGVPIYQWLADEVGMSVAGIRELAAEGQVSSEMFLNAIDKNIGGAAKIMGEEAFVAGIANVGAAVSRLGANFLDAGGDSRSFFQTVKGLIPKATEYIDSLGDSAEDLGIKFGEGLNNAIDWLVNLKKQFDALPEATQELIKKTALIGGAIAVGIGPALTVIGTLITSVGTVVSLIGSVVGVLAALATPMGIFGVALAGLGTLAILNFDTIKEKALEAFDSLMDHLGPFWEFLKEKWSEDGSGFADQFKSIFDGLKEISGTLFDGIYDMFSQVIQFLWDNKEVFVETIGKGLQFVSDSLPAVNEMLGSLLQVWSDILSKLLEEDGLFSNIFSGLGEIVQKVVPMVIEKLENLMSSIQSLWDAGGDRVLDILTDAWISFKDTILSVIDILEGAFDFLVAMLDGDEVAMRAAFDQMLEGLRSGLEAILKFFFTHGEEIEAAMGKILWNILKGLSLFVIDLMIDFGNWILDALVEIGAFIVKGIWTGIENTYGWFASKFKEFSNFIIDSFKTLFGIESPSTVFAELSTHLVTGMWEGISSMGSFIKGKIGDFAGGMIEKFKGGLSNVASIGSNIIKGIGSGMESAKGWLKSKVSNVSSMIQGIFKKDNDIHSPSRVFAEFGQNISEGVGVGLDEGSAAAINSMSNLSSGISDGFQMSGLDGVAKASMDGITTETEGGFAKLGELYLEGFEGLKELVIDQAYELDDGYSTVVGQMGDTTEYIFDWIKPIFLEGFEGVTELFKEKTKEIVDTYYEKIFNLGDRTSGGFGEIYDATIDGFERLEPLFEESLRGLLDLYYEEIFNLGDRTSGGFGEIYDATIDGFERLEPLFKENLKSLLDLYYEEIFNLGDRTSGGFGEIYDATVDGFERLGPVFEEGTDQLLSTYYEEIFNLGDRTSGGFGEIYDATVDGFERLGPVFEEGTEQLLSVWQENLGELKDPMNVSLEEVSESSREQLTNIEEIFNTGGESAIQGLTSGMESEKGELQEKTKEITDQVSSDLDEGTSETPEVGSGIVKGIWDGLQKMEDWLFDKIGSFVGWIVDGFKSLLGINSPSEVFADIATGIPEGIWNGIKSMGSWIKDKIGGFVGNMVGKFKGGLTNVGSIGSNIIKGIGNGMESAKGWLSDKVGAFTSMIQRKFKKDNEIKSPSRIFAEMAGWIPKGVGLGIEDNEDKAVNPLTRISEALEQAFDPDLDGVNLPNLDDFGIVDLGFNLDLEGFDLDELDVESSLNKLKGKSAELLTDSKHNNTVKIELSGDLEPLVQTVKTNVGKDVAVKSSGRLI